MTNHRIFLVLLTFFTLIFSVGCALLPSQTPEEYLQKRVEGLMQAKINGTWDVVYSFYDSSFRKGVSLDKFSSIPRDIDFKNFTIENIEMLPSKREATAKVKVDISVKGFTFKGAPENQLWIKEGRQWYLKARPGTQHPFAPSKDK
jgi:hypothetical protein